MGAFFTIVSQAINPTPVYIFSATGIGLILGGTVSGALLCVVLYRFLYRKKLMLVATLCACTAKKKSVRAS